MNSSNTQYYTKTIDISSIKSKVIDFKRMTVDDIPAVRPILNSFAPGSRTCDFTIGGLFMWTDYFDYEMAIIDGTLFVKGLNEMDLSQTAFSVPCGAMPLEKSLALLIEYCRINHIPCLLSAVPETLLPSIEKVTNILDVKQLDDWSDYLYDIHRLSSLEGKKLSKKRNHVNRFITDNPEWHFEPMSPQNLAQAIEFFEQQHIAAGKTVTADYERLQVLEVMSHPTMFGFQGGILYSNSTNVAAFAMGEIVGDTLYTHIEKMNHDIAGAGETINQMFSRYISEMYPWVKYVNREEDTGDIGLRQAKLSYHPDAILRKFNITI